MDKEARGYRARLTALNYRLLVWIVKKWLHLGGFLVVYVATVALSSLAVMSAVREGIKLLKLL